MGLSEHLAAGVQQLTAADPDKVRRQLRQIPGDGLFQQLGVQPRVLGLHRDKDTQQVLLLGKGNVPDHGGDVRLGQGRDNAKIFLKEHPEISDEIEKIVRANADRLLAAGKKGTVKPLDPSEIVKPAADGEAPAAASAPAAKTTGSEVDLDIMVDE